MTVVKFTPNTGQSPRVRAIAVGMTGPAQSPDDIITRVTEAPARADAVRVVEGVRSLATLRAVADLLHVEADGHGAPWLRRAIVAEARAGERTRATRAR